MKRNRKLAHHGRSALLWGICAYLLLQFALVWAIIDWRRDLRFMEYAVKRQLLAARMQEQPSAPLILCLGSSRYEVGLDVKTMTERIDQLGMNAKPLIFNLGMVQMDSVNQLIVFKDLLRAGIRPSILVLEFNPVFMQQDAKTLDIRWKQDSHRCTPRDMAAVLSLLPHTWPVAGTWTSQQLAAWNTQRSNLMSQYATSWLPPGYPIESPPPFDSLGWLSHRDQRASPEQYKANLIGTRDWYQEKAAHLKIEPTPDLALRDLLALCLGEKIPVIVTINPESTEYRSWYTPESTQLISDYLASLKKEYSVSVFDTRDWMPDDAFDDGHHMWIGGATDYSRKLAEGLYSQIKTDLAKNDIH